MSGKQQQRTGRNACVGVSGASVYILHLMNSTHQSNCPSGKIKLLICSFLRSCVCGGEVLTRGLFRPFPLPLPSAARWWRRCYGTKPWPTSPTTRDATLSTWLRGRAMSTSSNCSFTKDLHTPDSMSRSDTAPVCVFWSLFHSRF